MVFLCCLFAVLFSAWREWDIGKSKRLSLAIGNNYPSSDTVLMAAKHSYISQTLFFSLNRMWKRRWQIIYLTVTYSILFYSFTGLASSAGLLYLHTWSAAIAGNILAVFTMCVWPQLAGRFVSCLHPGKAMSTAMFAYVLELFFCVWCTAYKFVPGGIYFRESSHLLLGTFMTMNKYK